MARDNKDRYGYTHRTDEAHDIGDAKPGDVGDSKGTFFDRASQDNNVIVDGKTTSYENHKRAQESQNQNGGSKKSSGSDSNHTHPSFSEGQRLTVKIDRISNSGNAIAEYDGSHIHVKDGRRGETVEVEIVDVKGSYAIGEKRLRE